MILSFGPAGGRYRGPKSGLPAHRGARLELSTHQGALEQAPGTPPAGGGGVAGPDRVTSEAQLWP